MKPGGEKNKGNKSKKKNKSKYNFTEINHTCTFFCLCEYAGWAVYVIVVQH